MNIPKNPISIYIKKIFLSLIYKFKYRKSNLFIEYPSIIIKSCFGKYVKLYNNIIVNSSIDNYTYLGNNTQVLNTRIGKFCSISSGCIIGTSNHPSEKFISTHPIFYSISKQNGITFADKNYFNEESSITIGNDVWIGVNVIILGNIKIGDGAIIAAGAVVTKNVADYSIVGGVPAKHIRYRFSKEQRTILINHKWWLKSEDYLRKNYKYFHDIDIFISDNMI